MMRAVALTLIVFFLVPQEVSYVDMQVDLLVEQLKTLSPDADRATFLGRPAMSRLMALGPQAFPKLKWHFLHQEDWRLKASVGYLAVLWGRHDGDVAGRWRKLCKDPDVFVRMAMISLSGEFAQGPCGLVLMPVLSTEEKAVFDRIELPRSLYWMSEADLKSLAVIALGELKEGKPLVDPPWLESNGMLCLDPDPKELRSSGVRRLTQKAMMAELTLTRIFQTAIADEAMKLVMESAEADDGSDPPRLGHLLRMASSAVWHDGNCRTPDLKRNCPLAPEYKRRLFALCEKWAWTVTDSNAQYGIKWALDACGLWKGYDLRERLSKEHPDEQVRELAGSYLNQIWNHMYDQKYTREQEAADDLMVEAALDRK